MTDNKEQQPDRIPPTTPQPKDIMGMTPSQYLADFPGTQISAEVAAALDRKRTLPSQVVSGRLGIKLTIAQAYIVDLVLCVKEPSDGLGISS